MLHRADAHLDGTVHVRNGVVERDAVSRPYRPLGRRARIRLEPVERAYRRRADRVAADDTRRALYRLDERGVDYRLCRLDLALGRKPADVAASVDRRGPHHPGHIADDAGEQYGRDPRHHDRGDERKTGTAPKRLHVSTSPPSPSSAGAAPSAARLPYPCGRQGCSSGH